MPKNAPAKGVPKTPGKGAVDNQVVAATGLQAARAVEPRGGEQYGRKQGEQGAMLLACAAHKVERCQKRPRGRSHGARYQQDQRKQLAAGAHVPRVAAGICGKQALAVRDRAAGVFKGLCAGVGRHGWGSLFNLGQGVDEVGCPTLG